MPARPVQLLHVFPGFTAGGAQVRATDLMNALGPEWRHAVISLDGALAARDRVEPGITLELVESPPRAGSLATAARLRELLARRRPDLVLTYNFGAIDTLLAARTLAGLRLVHHEDGFGPDETSRLKRRRNWLRRLALPAADRLVVISRNLERIALEVWRQPRERVAYIPNGIDLERFARRPGTSGLRRELALPGDAVVVGSVGHLRPEKNLARLLRAARLAVAGGAQLHLLVLGEGPERAGLEALATQPPLAGRVHFVGYQGDPREHYRAMDLLALSSDTEQQPLALLEAMAGSLAVAATDVGDVRAMLPPDQGRWVVPCGPGADERLAAALVELAADPALRQRLGDLNRRRVETGFAREAMVEAYRRLYQEVLAGRPAPAARP